MKTTIYCFTISAFLFSCQSKPQEITKENSHTSAAAPAELTTFDSTNSEEFGEPTEQFSGNIKGNKIIFGHRNYTRYRLSEGGKSTHGELNTERGFGADKNATVFVLNYDKPESEQRYFVRFSDGRFTALDSARKEIPGAEFMKN